MAEWRPRGAFQMPVSAAFRSMRVAKGGLDGEPKNTFEPQSSQGPAVGTQGAVGGNQGGESWSGWSQRARGLPKCGWQGTKEGTQPPAAAHGGGGHSEANAQVAMKLEACVSRAQEFVTEHSKLRGRMHALEEVAVKLQRADWADELRAEVSSRLRALGDSVSHSLTDVKATVASMTEAERNGVADLLRRRRTPRDRVDPSAMEKKIEEKVEERIRSEMTEQFETKLRKMRSTLRAELESELRSEWEEEQKALCAELKRALRKKLRAELEPELERQVRQEFTGRERKRIERQLTDELEPQVARRLRRALKEHLTTEVREELVERIEPKLRVQLTEELRSELKMTLRKRVEAELHYDLREDVEAQLRLELEPVLRRRIEKEQRNTRESRHTPPPERSPGKSSRSHSRSPEKVSTRKERKQVAPGFEPERSPERASRRDSRSPEKVYRWRHSQAAPQAPGVEGRQRFSPLRQRAERPSGRSEDKQESDGFIPGHSPEHTKDKNGGMCPRTNVVKADAPAAKATGGKRGRKRKAEKTDTKEVARKETPVQNQAVYVPPSKRNRGLLDSSDTTTQDAMTPPKMPTRATQVIMKVARNTGGVTGVADAPGGKDASQAGRKVVKKGGGKAGRQERSTVMNGGGSTKDA
eukprot:Hpha_TRINITY_DN9552_c0_g2::TRINITY_DN9552_c0_g2_i1::g.115009::m.115009